MRIRRVQKHGQFDWKHQDVFLSETLAGEGVGLEAVDDRYYPIPNGSTNPGPESVNYVPGLKC